MKPHTSANFEATSNLALASLILASLFVVLGPIGSIAGIICGRKALKESQATGITEGDRMAQACKTNDRMDASRFEPEA